MFYNRSDVFKRINITTFEKWLDLKIHSNPFWNTIRIILMLNLFLLLGEVLKIIDLSKFQKVMKQPEVCEKYLH